MIYDLDKISLSLFGFKLDDSQKDALETIIHFLSNKDKDDIIRVVSGKAGTGKTAISAILINILKQNQINSYVVTPTNKSKNVLGHYLGDPKKVMTIHSFLNLRPDLNVLKFNAKDMQFRFDFNIFQPLPFSVYIIDEGSMINNELYDQLILQARKFRSKIVIFCDIKQLAPVKQSDTSKILATKCIELKSIHRQKDENTIHKVLDFLRERPIYKFKTIGDNLIVYHNFKELLKEKASIFKLAADLRDSSIIKVITYTNKRIEALNNYIRKIIYDNNEEYHYGEILTGYDTCTCKGGCTIQNSSDYIVYGATPTKWRNFKAWNLELFNMETSQTKNALILSKDNPEWLFDALAMEIEDLRLKAIKSKRWTNFYKLMDQFLTPIDLVFEDRIIKRKSLDYGYCISAHRSQGSNYSGVIVDIENMITCPDKETLRQLEYVALSRTRCDVYIYQK